MVFLVQANDFLMEVRGQAGRVKLAPSLYFLLLLCLGRVISAFREKDAGLVQVHKGK